VLAGERRETARLGTASGFARPAVSRWLRVTRRFAAVLLACGCVLPLLAPSRSSARSLVVRDAPRVASQRPIYPLHNHVPPDLTAAAPSQPDVPPSEGAFVPVLLVLALNSAAMVVRLVSSPPSWMKD
jgi:hypothetical protein